MKGKKITLILLITFFIGLLVLFYPTISEYYNSSRQSKAIVDYDSLLTEEKDYTLDFEKANAYNQTLSKMKSPLTDYKKLSDYEKLINVDGMGMMGYISIPKIKVEIPIYHGTSDIVLNSKVGHLEGSSLPVGGTSTHSVLSAHRGLPTAKLFSDLNKLEVGDTFVITVLDRKLTYQVDKITIVKPNDITDLKIVEGEDYVTLLTCTPYGINSHRLLVRGTRIENVKDLKKVITAEAYQIDNLIVTFAIALPILLILIMIVMFKPIKKVPNKEEI
ncbi:MAG: class C sortase [Erysipelotrichaceae bacterium]|nr:class C sortase [Erysipelotrichaceae bacterium]